MELMYLRENENESVAVTTDGEINLSNEEMRHLWFFWMMDEGVKKEFKGPDVYFHFAKPYKKYSEVLSQGRKDWIKTELATENQTTC